MSESLFRNLLSKKIYAILDGDNEYGSFEMSSGQKVNIGMPYLSGPTLCALSTQFGLPREYPWNGGAFSRWSYLEDILIHCIENGICSRFLEYLFSKANFQDVLHKIPVSDRDAYHKQCVSEVLKAINTELALSDSQLVFRDKKFEIIKEEREVLTDTEILEQVFNHNKEDPFSSIKEYDKCELIGNGGFGEVYRYHNQNLDMDFAVKIYRPWFVTDDEREKGEKRFFREAKILFSLNHKNIVRIYDAGRIEGDPFIRMEYLSGKNLEQLREEYGNFSPKSAVRAIIQVLEGLQCAHEAGIIHRDLKPTNIVTAIAGSKRICKIIDFGISAFMETDGYTKLTRTGEHIAGGQFIDPALISDPTLRDPRSDVYSAGAILYYLMCGRAPVGSNIVEYLKETNELVSDELVEILMKSLNLEIDKRFESCQEFSLALEQFK